MSIREQRREFRRDGQRRAEKAKGARVPLAYAVQVIVVDGPSFDPPVHEMRMGGTPEVFIEVKRAEQETCTHHFGQANRFGDTHCVSCGATAWSAWWVREGLYGDRTHQWMVDMDHRWRDLAEQSGIEVVQSTLGAAQIARYESSVKVIALLDAEEPARLVGRKGSVPSMKRGVLS